MAKIYEEAVRKARLLAEGLTNNIEEVTKHGVSKGQIDALVAIADDADAMNKELDELRAIVSSKTKAARDVLTELNAKIKDLKTAVKPHYDQDRWKWFGIEDKK
ncbi:MAG: hypothetical protein IJZ68_01560 [Bacteroidaceae bacterium]|nr:hypothetical protein [Bacteroidaceae bacterium]